MSVSGGADVLLVTSRDPFCGISSHSDMLLDAVWQADLTLSIHTSDDALNPSAVDWVTAPRVILLNYHRALHSRWTPEVVTVLKANRKVAIIFHDTFGELLPDDLSLRLHDLADAFIVHEPCIGLPKAIMWRQGVPESDDREGMWPTGRTVRPFVGTVGHDFPWKCYRELAETAAQIGWGLMLYVPAMSVERELELLRANRWLTVRRGEETQSVLAGLRSCDATAFTYTCGNSGTSAAIRLGIGARQPVIAFSSCRQNRDLLADPLAQRVIRWTDSFAGVQGILRTLPLTRLDPGTVELSVQDGWAALGQRYATLLRSLL